MSIRTTHRTNETPTSAWLVGLFMVAIVVAALTALHAVTPATTSEQSAATIAASQDAPGVQLLDESTPGTHDSCGGACDLEHQIFATSCMLTMLVSWSLLDVSIAPQSVELLPRDPQLVHVETPALTVPGDTAPSLQRLSISRI